MQKELFEPEVGSPEWKSAEWDRYRRLSIKHDGLTTPFWAALALGVTRQRVHQLKQAGVLSTVEIMGKCLIPCDKLLLVVHEHGSPRQTDVILTDGSI
jgi:hypothetical protein